MVAGLRCTPGRIRFEEWTCILCRNDGENDLYRLRFNPQSGRATGELERLTAEPTIETNGTLSDDGRLLAFFSDRGGSETPVPLSLRLERSHIDRKAVLHVRLQQSFIGFVNLLDRDDLNIGGNVMLAAEVEHLLGLRQTTDE